MEWKIIYTFALQLFILVAILADMYIYMLLNNARNYVYTKVRTN